MKKHKTQKYHRLAILSINEVLDKVRTQRLFMNVKGHQINLGSQRYKVFAKSLICVTCGIKGQFFAVEKHFNHDTKKYHLNLYAIDNDGCEVLMTKDHIIPKSLGGKDYLDNYQTMCSPCNSEKGALIV